MPPELLACDRTATILPRQVRDFSTDDPLTHGTIRGEWLFERLREKGVPLGETLLDVGCGYGGLSIAYARSGRSALAIDLDPDNLQVVSSRASKGESGKGSLRAIRTSATSLPLASESADLALMIGVLEWVGYADLSMRPRDLQRGALREVARVLRPDGRLIIGTKNRLFPRYFWSDAQVGRPLLNVLPARLADTVSTRLWRLPYRARIRSLWGWRSLIRSAGLEPEACFVPIFNYQVPLLLADLWSPRSIAEEIQAAVAVLAPPLRSAAVDVGRPGRTLYYRALARSGLLGLGAGSFLFVCGKTTRRSA